MSFKIKTNKYTNQFKPVDRRSYSGISVMGANELYMPMSYDQQPVPFRMQKTNSSSGLTIKQSSYAQNDHY